VRAKVVPPTAVTKVSGTAPKGTVAKLCVDEAGRVTGAKVMQAPGNDRSGAATALKRWRYQPYLEGGRPIPVCFAVTVR